MDLKNLRFFALLHFVILSTPMFIFANSSRQCGQFLKSAQASKSSPRQKSAKSSVISNRSKLNGQSKNRPERASFGGKTIVDLKKRRAALMEKYLILILETTVAQKQARATLKNENQLTQDPLSETMKVNPRERRVASNPHNRGRLNLPSVGDKRRALNISDKIFVEYFQSAYGLTSEMVRIFGLAFQGLNSASDEDAKLNSFEFAVRSLNRFDSKFYDLSENLFKFEKRLNNFLNRFDETYEEFNPPDFKDSVKEWMFLYFITHILSDLDAIHLYGNVLIEIATKQGLLNQSNEVDFKNASPMSNDEFFNVLSTLFKIPNYKNYVIETLGPEVASELLE